MFTKFTSLLVLVAPLASALTLNSPTVPINNGDTIDLTWTADANDVPFSLELVNPSFNNEYAIATNVDPATGSKSVQIPTVPDSTNYVINAVNIFNVSDVYSSTNVFAIGPVSSSSSSGSGSASSAVTSTAVTSTAVTTTGTSINTGLPTANSLPVTTSTVASLSSTGTGSGTSNTGSASGSAPSTLPTSAAVSSRLTLTNACGYAVLLLSVVGGTVAVAL